MTEPNPIPRAGLNGRAGITKARYAGESEIVMKNEHFRTVVELFPPVVMVSTTNR